MLEFRDSDVGKKYVPVVFWTMAFEILYDKSEQAGMAQVGAILNFFGLR